MSIRQATLAYYKLYFPLAVPSLLGIGVLTFDFVTDWLGYKAYQALDISQQASRRLAVGQHLTWDLTTLRVGYLELTGIYWNICIIASIALFVCVIWMYYSFLLERRHSLNKRDGFSVKESAVNLYAGEVLMLIHTLVEDLPIMVVFFLSKAFLTCHLFVSIGSPVFAPVLVSTAISVVCKLCMVVWNAGCVGCRDDHRKGLCFAIIRTVSLFFLLVTLTFCVFNLIFYFPALARLVRKSYPPNRLPFQGLHVEHWIKHDRVVFTTCEPEAAVAVANKTTRLAHIDLVKVEELMFTNNVVFKDVPCAVSNGTRLETDCTIRFAFQRGPDLQIYYDYKVMVRQNRTCKSEILLTHNYEYANKCNSSHVTPAVSSTSTTSNVMHAFNSTTIPTTSDVTSGTISANTTLLQGERNLSEETKANSRNPQPNITVTGYFDLSFISSYSQDCETICNFEFVKNSSLITSDLCAI